MRKVSFHYWFKSTRLYVGNGFFHTWGTETIETNGDNVVNTVGICEDEEGNVHMCVPSDIKFLEPLKQ